MCGGSDLGHTRRNNQGSTYNDNGRDSNGLDKSIGGTTSGYLSLRGLSGGLLTKLSFTTLSTFSLGRVGWG